jgi:hypothetical protein
MTRKPIYSFMDEPPTATYIANQKVLDPYFRHFLQSPVVSLGYWAQVIQATWQSRRSITLN